MQLFSADAMVFSKKNLKKNFDPENIKKRPQKLLIIGPQLFFSVLPTGPNPAQISIPVP